MGETGMGDPKGAGGIFWKAIVAGAGAGALATTAAILVLKQTVSDGANTSARRNEKK